MTTITQREGNELLLAKLSYFTESNWKLIWINLKIGYYNYQTNY